jgi:hypothetical protein
VYQLSSKVEGDRDAVKTYHRVNDGESIDDDDGDKKVEEFVTAKKSVSRDKQQRQRAKPKEKGKRRALKLEKMELVGRCCRSALPIVIPTILTAMNRTHLKTTEV